MMTRRANERVALLVASLTSFLTPFMGGATNVALASIGRDLRRRRDEEAAVAPAVRALTPTDLDVAQGGVEDDRR